jgi:hypothetical protein
MIEKQHSSVRESSGMSPDACYCYSSHSGVASTLAKQVSSNTKQELGWRPRYRRLEALRDTLKARQ